MPIETNEFNQIKLHYPLLLWEGEYYLDYTSLVDLTGQKSTSLFRLIKGMKDVKTFEYKNRKYYSVEFGLRFWKWVARKQ